MITEPKNKPSYLPKKILSTAACVLVALVFPIIAYAQTNRNENKADGPDRWNFQSIELSIGRIGYTKKLTPEILKELVRLEPYLVRSLEKRAEIENIYHCPTDPIACHLTQNRRHSIHISKKTDSKINEDLIGRLLSEIRTETSQDPTEARFSMENGRVSIFMPSENGFEIDLDESQQKLREALNEMSGSKVVASSIELPLEEIEPEIKTSDINDLGINELIGEGESDFKGSSKSRIHNIYVALKRFDGILIKPGDEFSFVETLGPVDGEHGYLPELVIKRNKTEPEFGGGICQVSTTIFRAAIYSGLKITARRNHAYPVQYYYPHGMDATIYLPWPDLKFINNTPGHILIQSSIEGTKLKLHFYGSGNDRQVAINGPTITEKAPDGSMKTVFTQKVTDRNGSVLIEDVFRSAYDSPDNYPRPEAILTEKPKEWSSREWREYQASINP